MLRIDFHRPLDTIEFRESCVGVFDRVAKDHGLFAKFQQPQQRAFDGYSGQKNRTRIGNGNHKNWRIDFQKEHKGLSNPTVVGRVAIQAPIDIENMEYGGFHYGKNLPVGEWPLYTYATFHTPSELGHWNPNDPEPTILEATYTALIDYYENTYPRLFDIRSV